MKTDNELIAEFMRLKRHKIETHLFWVPIFDAWVVREALEYHISWDWLMPVVEEIHRPKIKKNKVVREGADVYINYRNCVIEYCDDDIEYDLHPEGISGESKIEAVYKAVVEFIKWLNQQNK